MDEEEIDREVERIRRRPQEFRLPKTANILTPTQRRLVLDLVNQMIQATIDRELIRRAMDDLGDDGGSDGRGGLTP